MSEFIPNPPPRPVTYLDEEFWQHCATGKLGFQCCEQCGTWRHIPRFMCAKCGSDEWAWRESSGRGEVYTWTVCYMPMSREFETIFPYAVLVVEMEEGVRITAGLRDLDYEELSIGLPVEVIFEPLADGTQLPFFRPRRST
ncbi:MAG: putative OB-fold protein [Gammaproteobacteria bacterium]|jgi:uncharacterized OB-fold protein